MHSDDDFEDASQGWFLSDAACDFSLSTAIMIIEHPLCPKGAGRA